jgi:thiamine-phosphate pyrophosphorylase
VLAPLSIYPIIDAAVCADRQVHPLSVAAAYLRGGARVMQLRHKAGGSADVLALARRLVAVAATYGAEVVVNDRADLAALAGAAGVHVGQEDLPVDDVRRLVGSTALVGLSAHTLDEIDAALASSASYVAVGPIFGTTTKDTGYGPRGLELVHYAAGRGKPVVAIGGITLARARQVMNAGASGVAVISDLLVTRDPEGRVRDYIHALG